LVELIKTTDDLIFPVLNEKGQLQGLIDVAEIRPVIFSPFKIKYTSIQEVMQPPKEIIFYDETMETIIEKFENSQTQILPVLKDGKFIGFMAKISILEKYREKLKAMIIE
jgi:CIC family chloride channel protein